MKFLSLMLFSLLIYSEASLLSLTDVSRISLNDLKAENSLLIAFQADCASCKKQINDLRCLEKDYSIKLVGIASTEKALRKEYRKIKTNYPAFYATPSTLKKLNISDAITPQLIVWKNGQAQRFYGYKKCQQYQSLFEKVNNG